MSAAGKCKKQFNAAAGLIITVDLRHHRRQEVALARQRASTSSSPTTMIPRKGSCRCIRDLKSLKLPLSGIPKTAWRAVGHRPQTLPCLGPAFWKEEAFWTDLLDLAPGGTAADVVPVDRREQDNRLPRLLEKLRQTKNPDLRH